MVALLLQSFCSQEGVWSGPGGSPIFGGGCLQFFGGGVSNFFGGLQFFLGGGGGVSNFLGEGNVTGPPGALLFDVKPEIAQEKSL